jgi:transposase
MFYTSTRIVCAPICWSAIGIGLGCGFQFLLYDVTSTYFEGQAKANPKAARGYSRDHRPDCKQVNIGLVVTPEGLPIGYEVFAGNTAHVTTVEDMVKRMEDKCGQAQRIWVMDPGMISEDNLDFLGNRRLATLWRRPRANSDDSNSTRQNRAQVQDGVEVKLVPYPG